MEYCRFFFFCFHYLTAGYNYTDWLYSWISRLSLSYSRKNNQAITNNKYLSPLQAHCWCSVVFLWKKIKIASVMNVSGTSKMLIFRDILSSLMCLCQRLLKQKIQRRKRESQVNGSSPGTRPTCQNYEPSERPTPGYLVNRPTLGCNIKMVCSSNNMYKKALPSLPPKSKIFFDNKIWDIM